MSLARRVVTGALRIFATVFAVAAESRMSESYASAPE
jgi:hypothetical protein